jgi:DNA polymerase III subunit chi
MRVDFHFNVDHRLQYACRVVRKARGAGKSVLAFAREPDRLARFDAALWTFSALDFLPHVYADSPLAADTPILLTLQADAAPARDVLLNLDDATPPDFTQWFACFERVIEVVSLDDADRQLARARFNAYRAAGIEPTTFKATGE